MNKYMGKVFCSGMMIGVLAAAGSMCAVGEEAGGYSIGFSTYSDANSFRQQQKAELEEKVAQLQEEGIISDFVYLDSNDDQSKQISDINDLITMGCDAIVVNAITGDGLNDIVEEAMEEGIVVISYDNLVTTDNVTAKIVISDYDFGHMIGTWLGEQLPDGGQIVVLDGIAGTTTNEQRHNGMLDGLNEISPNSEVIANVNCDWDYATAKTAMEDILSAYPEFDGILSQGGAMSLAAVDAMEAAGRDLVPMTGEALNGYLKIWNSKLEDGFESIAFAAPTYMASTALETAIKALNGEEVGPEVALETPAITNDNLSEYVREDLSDDYWVITNMGEELKTEMYAE